MNHKRHSDLVLAIYPFTRGFAFTLFQGPLSPIDWGIKTVVGVNKNALSLGEAEKLLGALQPDVLVLENCSGTLRALRIKRLIPMIANSAIGRSIEVHSYRRAAVRKCFKNVGALTRYEIAQAIAAQVHAFEILLPPSPKLGDSDNPRMSLFAAAALAMTHYSEVR